MVVIFDMAMCSGGPGLSISPRAFSFEIASFVRCVCSVTLQIGNTGLSLKHVHKPCSPACFALAENER